MVELSVDPTAEWLALKMAESKAELSAAYLVAQKDHSPAYLRGAPLVLSKGIQ